TIVREEQPPRPHAVYGFSQRATEAAAADDRRVEAQYISMNSAQSLGLARVQVRCLPGRGVRIENAQARAGDCNPIHGVPPARIIKLGYPASGSTDSSREGPINESRQGRCKAVKRDAVHQTKSGRMARIRVRVDEE